VGTVASRVGDFLLGSGSGRRPSGDPSSALLVSCGLVAPGYPREGSNPSPSPPTISRPYPDTQTIVEKADQPDLLYAARARLARSRS
jgi:hypothetical protein